LLGRIEQSKFITAQDLKTEQEKEEALKRKAQMDQLYMPMVESDYNHH
jgi:hypothetical protein